MAQEKRRAGQGGELPSGKQGPPATLEIPPPTHYPMMVRD